MKRLLLSFVLLLGVAGVSYGFDKIPVPETDDGTPFADGRYGGVRVATANFFATNTNGSITLPVGAQELAITSLSISSGPGETYVTFYSSYSWSASTPYFFRVTNGSSTAFGDSTSGTMRNFELPFRVERSTAGAGSPQFIFRVVNADDNQRHSNITIGYVIK